MSFETKNRPDQSFPADLHRREMLRCCTMRFSTIALLVCCPTALAFAFPEPDGSPNSPITRNGSRLFLNEHPWTASGANVYWLGLDENVAPPPGEEASSNISYPTKGRITEVMATLQTLGARTVRSHTLGVSVGNPLSVWPELGVTNEKAFDSMDWAVKEARRFGLRLFVPLVGS